MTAVPLRATLAGPRTCPPLDPGGDVLVGAQATGRVHSWDLSTGTDGPGTRVVVFLAGCPLRCVYCHNPDTWRQRDGAPMTVDEVTAVIDRYRRFVSVAGGGVTLSGGEPLQQAGFAGAILRASKERGLHTALDTSGFLGDRASDALLDATDLVLLDVKSWDPATYRTVTGGRDVEPTLRFAWRLADRGTPLWIRFVVVPGYTDAAENVEGVARFVAGLGTVTRVDVLGLHHLGAPKYAALGLPYPVADVPAPSSAVLHRVREQFACYGLTVT